MPKDWHLPYEDDPLAGETKIPLQQAENLAGGVAVRAGFIETADEVFPVLSFVFQDRENKDMPMITLVVTDGVMRNVDRLVNSAVTSALRAADLKRREKHKHG